MKEEISEKEFLKYEAVRKGGLTNMLNIQNIMALSGLSREKVTEIMKNYRELAEKYLKVKNYRKLAERDLAERNLKEGDGK